MDPTPDLPKDPEPQTNPVPEAPAMNDVTPTAPQPETSPASPVAPTTPVSSEPPVAPEAQAAESVPPSNPTTPADENIPVPSEPPTAVTSESPSPVVSGGVGAPAPAKVKKPRRWLKWAIPAGVTVVVLGGGGAAAYFGYYMNPSVIWSQSMSNTAKGLSRLTDYTKHLAASPPGKGLDMSGDYKVTSGGSTIDGTVSSVSDGKNSKATVDLNLPVAKIEANVIGVAVPNDTNSDWYLQVKGFKGLADLSGMGSVLDTYDGQWIAINHTLLDDLEGMQKQATKSSIVLTGKDVLDLTQSFSATTQQYVFSSSSKTAVMTVAQKIGKETQDGRSVYHYKVHFDKANLKAYVQALRDDLQNSQVGKYLTQTSGQSIDKVLNFSDLLKSIDNIKSNYTADVWVDMGTRLVHKVRFPDVNNSDTYFEVGQNYSGGNTYPFVLTFHEKNGTDVTTTTVETALDSKANSLTTKLTVDEKDSANSGNNGSATIDLTLKPTNGSVSVTAPKDAKSLADIMNELGLGAYYDELTSPNSGLLNGGVSSQVLSL
ncbi:MAG TPA: hypothetical protein VHD60_03805 [Candidatus Saccharimonadales bacterium]|nr:hypothetical protein [Candidatus Saccharimonadales bacterium]